MTDRSTPKARIQAFIDARTGMRGLDQDVVHGVDSKGQSEELTLSDLRALLAELESAQKDAERYRWLRGPDSGPWAVLPPEDVDDNRLDCEDWVPGELDEAIDKAMKGKP